MLCFCEKFTSIRVLSDFFILQPALKCLGSSSCYNTQLCLAFLTVLHDSIHFVFHWQSNSSRSRCCHHHAEHLLQRFSAPRLIRDKRLDLDMKASSRIYFFVQILFKLEGVDFGVEASFLVSSLSVHGDLKLFLLKSGFQKVPAHGRFVP